VAVPRCRGVLSGCRVWTAPHVRPLPPVNGPVTFDRVRSIVGQRCIVCHSRLPPSPHHQPPAESSSRPSRHPQNAQRIYQQVVVTRIMPLGNATAITDEERAVVSAWVLSAPRGSDQAFRPRSPAVQRPLAEATIESAGRRAPLALVITPPSPDHRDRAAMSQRFMSGSYITSAQPVATSRYRAVAHVRTSLARSQARGTPARGRRSPGRS